MTTEVNRLNPGGPIPSDYTKVPQAAAHHFEQMLAQTSPGDGAGADAQEKQRLQTSLDEKLTLLKMDRETLESSTYKTGAGTVPVQALLQEQSPLEQLRIFNVVAAQKLEEQRAAMFQPAESEPPVVGPVSLTKPTRMKQGELYELSVGEGTPADVVKLMQQSFTQYSFSTYYGSTYHLQFLDANDQVMHLGGVVAGSNDHMSIYWHGGYQDGGTVFSVGGDLLEYQVDQQNKIIMPSLTVETEAGPQYLPLEKIPFAKIRISNEANALFKLPTKADVDEARAALQNPEQLTLQQLLKYTGPALQRAAPDLANKIAAATQKGNLLSVINHSFSATESPEEIIDKVKELSTYVISNRRGFDRMADVDSFFVRNIKTTRLEQLKHKLLKTELAAKADQDFSDVDLTLHGDFDLRGVNLKGLNLEGQIFYKLDLSGADLRGADLSNTIFVDVKLNGAKLNDAKMSNSSLLNVDLRGASLKRVYSESATFYIVDMRSANLHDATLSGAHLSKTLLNGANLGGVYLESAYLARLDLSGVNLKEAYLQEADLSETDLSGSNLYGAGLEGAILVNADLGEADLRQSRLVNADLSGAIIGRIRIDQGSLLNNPGLSARLNQQSGLETTYSYNRISGMERFATLLDLQKELAEKRNVSLGLADVDTYMVDKIIVPRIKHQQRELIHSGLSAGGFEFHNQDFSHRDLRETKLAGASFVNSNFSYANMQGLNLSGTAFVEGENNGLDGAQLSQADLSKAKLKYLSAVGVQLQGANLQNAELNTVSLQRGDLSEADISGATLSLVDLSQTNIERLKYNENTYWGNVILTAQQAKSLKLQLVDSQGNQYSPLESLPDHQRLDIYGNGASPEVIRQVPELPRAMDRIARLSEQTAPRSGIKEEGAYDFSGLDLTGRNLSNAAFDFISEDIFAEVPEPANFDGSNFQRATLRGVNFEGNSLVLADFSHADLSAASLESTSIMNADFRQANLTNSSLKNANAQGAIFRGAQLVESDLSKAAFNGADLREANLSGANLTGVDLRGADLSGADLSGAEMVSMIYDEQTLWHGAKLPAGQAYRMHLSQEKLTPKPYDENKSNIQARLDLPNTRDQGSAINQQNQARGSGFDASSALSPLNNPNGIIGNDGTQAGHGNNGNNNGAITAVAGDAPDPDQPFQVINGQVNVSGIQLPELDLSGNVAQSGESIFGTPVGLPELPTYTSAPRTEEGAADIPVADNGSETTPPIAQQPGGVTIGGQLGNDKGKTAAQLGLDPSGKLPGPEKAKAPDPIPGFGEGVNSQDLNQSNTRDWGGGPVTPDQAKLTPEGFPQQDKTLENILNPEGLAGARFRFPPGNEEIPAAEYQAVVKALPTLQQISVGEYSQLSAADQNNIISRAVEYQALPADIKANTSLLQYADSRQTSASQRGQMLDEQQRQTAQTTQQALSDAQSGLSDSTIQLINTRINALQQNTAAINQQTQVLTQSNANRQNALAAPTTSDPVTAAFIKPDIKPGQTPPASNSAATTSQLNTQADPIPRFMVVNTAKGPQLIENLPNGKTQMLPYPIPADTPVTQQASNGSWTHVPDAYAIGAKNLLDTLFLQGAVKMLNNGNAVQSPGTQSAPTTPTGIPRPAF